MDLTKKTAAELKKMAIDAIAKNDRALITKITAEVKKRAQARIEDGTATEKLKDLNSKIR